ncbi:MAG: hypothetical protein KDD42_08690 [Bdellovibrionales bacterium]|nr:hypothetical protein [Bdellovibrionales bacterium]
MLAGNKSVQIDNWTWGREIIIWGYSPEHKYTFKILEPKKGRAGCLSLQYHHDKSETWLVLNGIAWILVVFEGQICTRIMRPGDVQNLPAGTIHRLMAVTDNLRVAEPSTPDVHAADKSKPKDVVRLHCVHGRECSAARDSNEARIVELATHHTAKAIESIAAGATPEQQNLEILAAHGAFSLD